MSCPYYMSWLKVQGRMNTTEAIDTAVRTIFVQSSRNQEMREICLYSRESIVLSIHFIMNAVHATSDLYAVDSFAIECR